MVDLPPIPMMWPAKRGNNLTVKAILVLDEAGFQLQQCGALSTRHQFQVSMDMPLPWSHLPVPPNPSAYDKFRHGYAIGRSMEPPLVEQRNKWSSAALMNRCFVSTLNAIT